MAKSITGEKIHLRNVRLSFPQLHKPDVPKGYENAEPKYSASFLLDPKDEKNKALIKQCSAEIKRLIEEAWKTRPPKMKPIECFGKGENYVNKTSKEPYGGYEGMWVVVAQNAKRPLCLTRGKAVMTPEEIEQKLYAGCYVNAIVNFWVQDNQYGEAIRCSLSGVQFFGDGESFSAGGATVDDFDDLEDGEVDMSDGFETEEEFDFD